jgi:hypothetical protein
MFHIFVRQSLRHPLYRYAISMQCKAFFEKLLEEAFSEFYPTKISLIRIYM